MSATLAGVDDAGEHASAWSQASRRLPERGGASVAAADWERTADNECTSARCCDPPPRAAPIRLGEIVSTIPIRDCL